jgi:hypothetical protein
MSGIMNWFSVTPVEICDLQNRDVPGAQHEETMILAIVQIYKSLSRRIKSSSGCKCVDGC